MILKELIRTGDDHRDSILVHLCSFPHAMWEIQLREMDTGFTRCTFVCFWVFLEKVDLAKFPVFNKKFLWTFHQRLQLEIWMWSKQVASDVSRGNPPFDSRWWFSYGGLILRFLGDFLVDSKVPYDTKSLARSLQLGQEEPGKVCI